MTLGTQTTYAERRARVQPEAMTITNASDATKTYINAGVREFAKRTNGLPKETYLTVSPSFSLHTNFGLRLTITDGANALAATELAVVSNTYTDAGGASMATALQQQFSAAALLSVSISWNAASWVFVINSYDSNTSYIEVAGPTYISYVDATPTLFDLTGTQSGQTWTGNFPLDCTLETDLPSDFFEIEYAEWDGNQLTPAPHNLFSSPESSGTPIWYAVKNRKIRLSPCPNRQEKFLIRYRYFPDDLATDGTDDSENCPLASEFHWAPVYYAAAKIFEERHESEKASLEYGLFDDQVKRYRMSQANQTPTLFPSDGSSRIGPVTPDALD